MSVRENIASNIVTVLTAISSPITLKKITRQPFEPRDLSQQQYPCAWVESAEETREDASLNEGTRQGTVDFVIMGFVQGAESNIDTARNQLITAIETALDLDRTRDSNALDTEVISIETDEGTIFP